MTLSWIPLDKTSIEIAERNGLTVQLFDVARTAREQGAQDVARDLEEVLLDRACCSQAEAAGWNSLSKSLQALCVLAVMSEDAEAINRLVEKFPLNSMHQLSPDICSAACYPSGHPGLPGTGLGQHLLRDSGQAAPRCWFSCPWGWQ